MSKAGYVGAFFAGVAVAAPVTGLYMEARDRAEAARETIEGSPTTSAGSQETLPLNPSETVITVGTVALTAPPRVPTKIYAYSGITCFGPQKEFTVNEDDRLELGFSATKGIQDSIPGSTTRSIMPSTVAENFARDLYIENKNVDLPTPEAQNDFPMGTYLVYSQCENPSEGNRIIIP